MPHKPRRPCQKAGCKNLAKEQYCPEHIHLARQETAESNRRYDQTQRDQQAAAFYHSVAWDRARQQALIRDYGLCQECLSEKQITLASLVDHILPLKVAWHLRITLDNLRSLCEHHHAAKTAEDNKKYRRYRK